MKKSFSIKYDSHFKHNLNTFIILFKDAESPSNSNEKISEESLRSTNRGQTENEFVSDSYDHENLNADEIKSELKQLNLENKKLDGKKL